jgi:hypothetical protein
MRPSHNKAAHHMTHEVPMENAADVELNQSIRSATSIICAGLGNAARSNRAL